MKLLVSCFRTVLDVDGLLALSENTLVVLRKFNGNASQFHHAVQVGSHIHFLKRTLHHRQLAKCCGGELTIGCVFRLLHLRIARCFALHGIDGATHLGILSKQRIQRRVLYPAATRSVLNPYRRTAIGRTANHLGIGQRQFCIGTVLQCTKGCKTVHFRIVDSWQRCRFSILVRQRHNNLRDVGRLQIQHTHTVGIAVPYKVSEGTAGRLEAKLGGSIDIRKLNLRNSLALRSLECQRAILLIHDKSCTIVGGIDARRSRTARNLQTHTVNAQRLVDNPSVNITDSRTDGVQVGIGKVEGGTRWLLTSLFDSLSRDRHQEPARHVVDHDTRYLRSLLRPGEVCGQYTHIVACLHRVAISIGQRLVLSTTRDGHVLDGNKTTIVGLRAGIGNRQCRTCQRRRRSLEGRSIRSSQLVFHSDSRIVHVVNGIVSALRSDDIAIQNRAGSQRDTLHDSGTRSILHIVVVELAIHTGIVQRQLHHLAVLSSIEGSNVRCLHVEGLRSRLHRLTVLGIGDNLDFQERIEGIGREGHLCRIARPCVVGYRTCAGSQRKCLALHGGYHLGHGTSLCGTELDGTFLIDVQTDGALGVLHDDGRIGSIALHARQRCFAYRDGVVHTAVRKRGALTHSPVVRIVLEVKRVGDLVGTGRQRPCHQRHERC